MSKNGRDRGEWREVERMLGRLSGADGAVVSGNGHASHIRILPTAHPDRAVAEARSALAATSSRRLDDVAVEPQFQPRTVLGRWALTSLEWSRRSGGAHVRVCLDDAGETSEGEADGPADEMARSAARATVVALRATLGAESEITLADLKAETVAGRVVWLAALHFTRLGQRTLLLGTAMEDGGRNPLETVARACLDGANRALRKEWSSSDGQALLKFFAH